MATLPLPIVERPLPWTPCGDCWGQRVIYENHNGEGLVPCACPRCLGTGEQMRVH